MNVKDIVALNEKETRAGFGEGIHELAKENSEVLVLTADLAGSFKLGPFIKEFPDRFIEVGIAEANMISMAAGLTIGGKIPYTTTFANFSTGRVYDQIRQSVAYSDKNVEICASHAGLTLGEDGATHQILEDIGLMKMLPGMTVVVPCDFNQTKAATKAIANYHGPVYLRFGRPKWPNFTKEDGSDFVIGKAQKLSEGKDITLFACGHLVWKAIEAGKILEATGVSVEVINIHTIKPLDVDAIVASISKTGSVFSLWTTEPTFSNANGTLNFGGGSETGTTANAIYDPTTQSGSYANGVNVEQKGGFSMFGAQLGAGMDYYVAENIYVGLELGISYTSKSKDDVTTIGTTPGGAINSTVPGYSKSYLSTAAGNAALRLGWRF